MRRRLIVLVVGFGCAGVAVGAALAAGSGAGGGAGASVRAARHAPGADRFLGRVAPSAQVRFGLTLRMNSAALERYAAAVGAHAAPALSATQIGERFGVPSPALARVVSALRGGGVRVDTAFKQRTQLLVSAPAATVERLLDVRLGEFTDRSGHQYHRPLGAPVVPASLRGAVIGATQLNTKPLFLADAVPQGGMTATELASLYDIKPLMNQGLDGSGQTVAVFSEDTFQNSDITAFEQEHNITGAPQIQRVEVHGNVAYQSGDAAAEVDLDTEVIRELAPRARILNYEICCGADAFSPGIDRIVSDGQAKLVNFSYGICEFDTSSQQALISANNSFASAEAHGVTVFASSGDQGAYECQRYDLTDHRLSVGFPGSSPNVVSVGGTYVDLRQDGTRLDELGWEDILTHGGGGGGVSAAFRRPSWQTGVPGINNQYTTSPARRQVPDVAAAGSPGSGYAVHTGGSDTVIGGTSASAPLWTGAFVLIDELAQKQTGRALPFIAPLLYRAEARDPSAFYDVKLGGNRFYRAGPGWDYSTGLGAPDMARLAGDVIALAQGR
jgi:subtilase family serine protease